MRVVQVSTNDIEGGAARAAYRLHDGLLREGVDSRMVVRARRSDDITVGGPDSTAAKAWSRLAGRVDRMPLSIYRRQRVSTWSVGWVPTATSRRIQELRPEVVNLHWVGGGFMPPAEVRRLQAPVVWTLHDMEPFTGGCHYSGGCSRYREGCGRCPQLGSGRAVDLSRWTLRRKARAWEDLPFTVVAPSRWLATCASESALFAGRRVEVIPYGLDLDVFRPIDRHLARDLLGLPHDRRLILFGAVSSTTEPRKGFASLRDAIGHVAARVGDSDTELIVFGASRPPEDERLGIPARYLGHLHDDVSLVLLYSAADLFVAPSLEDNLPNTVLEATACGTPTVAFRIGGMPDMIEHGRTGYLADTVSAADLSAGVLDLLADDEKRVALGAAAREKATREFEMRRAARLYAGLYEELVLRGRPPGERSAAAHDAQLVSSG